MIDRLKKPTYRLLYTSMIIVAGILFLTTLFLPPDGDQALFYVSGQKLLAGDVLYRDIVDLKPPLIYFLNAGAIGLFGESFLSVRILETLFQFGTALLLFMAVRKSIGRIDIASIAAILYAMLYFGMNFNDRAQVEGFAALPIAGLLYLICFRGEWYRYLLAGVLVGLLGLLKTTLLILLVPALAVLYTHYPLRSLLPRAALLVGGMLLPYCLTLLYFIMTGGVSDYLLIQEFVTGYASQQIGSPMSIVTSLTRIVPAYMARTWTIVVMIAVAIGIGRTTARWISARDRVTRRAFDSPRSSLLLFTLLSGLLLAGTIVLEGKFLSWHFVRLLVPVAVVGGVGYEGIVEYLSRRPAPTRALTAAILLAVPIILFSPIPRLLWTSAASIATLRGGVDGFVEFYGDGEGEGAYSMKTISDIGNMIGERLEPGESLFVSSGWGGLFHYYAENVPDFRIYHSGYLIAPYSPDEWKLATAQYLMREKPTFIVLQRDAMPHISGTDITSEEAVRVLPGVDSLLQTGYDTLMVDDYTLVLERKGDLE